MVGFLHCHVSLWGVYLNSFESKKNPYSKTMTQEKPSEKIPKCGRYYNNNHLHPPKKQSTEWWRDFWLNLGGDLPKPLS